MSDGMHMNESLHACEWFMAHMCLIATLHALVHEPRKKNIYASCVITHIYTYDLYRDNDHGIQQRVGTREF